MILYLITNTVNGKQYVGITSGTIRRRFGDHVRASRSPRVPLHLAIAKYGRDAFRVEELARASSRADLCRMEREEIAHRGCASPDGYNLTSGGDGNSPGYVTPEAARSKIGDAARRVWAERTPEERAEIGRRISEAKRGKAPKHAGRRSLKGTTRDEDFKARVSAGMKRTVASLPEGEMARRARLQKQRKT